MWIVKNITLSVTKKVFGAILKSDSFLKNQTRLITISKYIASIWETFHDVKQDKCTSSVVYKGLITAIKIGSYDITVLDTIGFVTSNYWFYFAI